MLFLSTLLVSSYTAPPPKTSDHPGFARWIATSLTWGVLSTTSTRSEGSTKGDAFGNPYSFADVDGVPYFYASGMDASMVDLFGSDASTSRGTLSLTEASSLEEVAVCKIGHLLGDPENPPCARLVLSGSLAKVAAGSDEETAAKKALFAKHPSFKMYPPGHAFYVVKMEVDGVWLIDAYGGAATPSAKEYLDYKPSLV
jgi:hypothetical protein